MKFTIRQIALATLLIFLSPGVSAQKPWTPGYLIPLSADTLKGFILNQDWNKAPKEVRFKTDETADEALFLANEIRGFGLIGGNEYELINVRLDVTPVKLEELKYVDTLRYERGSWLARVLLRGTVNLYFLKDDNSKVHYLVSAGDEPVTELILRKELVRTEGTFRVNTFENYKGQLRVLTAACPELEPQINRLSFSERSLREFLHDYNRCINPNEVSAIAKISEKKSKILAKGYLVGGLSLNQARLRSVVVTRFFGRYYYLYPEMRPSFQPHYALGIGGQFILPHRHRKWSILGEMLYKPTRLTGSYQEYRGDVFELDFRLTYVRFQGIARREFGSRKLTPFVQTGTGLALLTYHSEHAEKMFPRFRHFDESVLAGFGGRIDNMEVEFRGELNRAFSEELSSKSSSSSLYLLFKYLF